MYLWCILAFYITCHSRYGNVCCYAVCRTSASIHVARFLYSCIFFINILSMQSKWKYFNLASNYCNCIWQFLIFLSHIILNCPISESRHVAKWPGFESQVEHLGFFLFKFACFLSVYLGFLWVLWMPWTVQLLVSHQHHCVCLLSNGLAIGELHPHQSWIAWWINECQSCVIVIYKNKTQWKCHTGVKQRKAKK